MTYVDTPAPSGAYLLAIAAGCLLLALAYGLIYYTLRLRLTPLAAGVFTAVTGLVPFVVMALVVHAALDVRYQIDDANLRMRAGVASRTVPLASIAHAEPVHRVGRTFGGTFGARGYANRFTDGVRLHVGADAINLSPADVDAFLAVLSERGVAVR